jgi:hypothetical protein
VAQPGSVLAWGASGRPFKSARPDQYKKLMDSGFHELFSFCMPVWKLDNVAKMSQFFFVVLVCRKTLFCLQPFRVADTIMTINTLLVLKVP